MSKSYFDEDWTPEEGAPESGKGGKSYFDEDWEPADAASTQASAGKSYFDEDWTPEEGGPADVAEPVQKTQKFRVMRMPPAHGGVPFLVHEHGAPGFPTPDVPSVGDIAPGLLKPIEEQVASPAIQKAQRLAMESPSFKIRSMYMLSLAAPGNEDLHTFARPVLLHAVENDERPANRKLAAHLLSKLGVPEYKQGMLTAAKRGLSPLELTAGPEGRMGVTEGAAETVMSYVPKVLGIAAAPGSRAVQHILGAYDAIDPGVSVKMNGVAMLLGIDPNRTGWSGPVAGLSSTFIADFGNYALRKGTEAVLSRAQFQRAWAEEGPNPEAKVTVENLSKILPAAKEAVRDFTMSFVRSNPGIVGRISEAHWAVGLPQLGVGGLGRSVTKSTAHGIGREFDGIIRNIEKARIKYAVENKIKISDVPGMLAFAPHDDLDLMKVVESTVREVPGAILVTASMVRAGALATKYWSDPSLSFEQKLDATGNVLSEMGSHMAHRYHLLFNHPGELMEEGAFKVFFDVAMLYQIPAAAARIVARRALAKARDLAKTGKVPLMVEQMTPENAADAAANAARQVEVAKIIEHMDTILGDAGKSRAQLLSIEEKLLSWRIGRNNARQQRSTAWDAELVGGPRHGEPVEAFAKELAPGGKGRPFDFREEGALAEIVDVDLVARMKRAYKIANPRRREHVMSKLRRAQHARDMLRLPRLVKRQQELLENIGQVQKSMAEFSAEKHLLMVNRQRILNAPKERVVNPKLSPKAKKLVEEHDMYMEAAKGLDELAFYHLPVVGQTAALWRGFATSQWLQGTGRVWIPFLGRVDKAKVRHFMTDPTTRLPMVQLAARRTEAGGTADYAHRLQQYLTEMQPEHWPIMRDLGKLDADGNAAKYLDWDEAGKAGSRYKLKEGVEVTPELIRMQDVWNRYGDFPEFLVENHELAKSVSALYAPELANPWYYGENYKMFFEDWPARAKYFGEYISNPHAETALGELMALHYSMRSKALGRSVKENHMRRNHSLEAREAGIIKDRGVGVRLSDSFPEEMGLLVKHVADMQHVKAMGMVMDDASVYTPFMSRAAEGPGIPVLEDAYRAAKASGSEDATAAALKDLMAARKARDEAIVGVGDLDIPSDLNELIARTGNLKDNAAINKIAAEWANIKLWKKGQVEGKIPIVKGKHPFKGDDGPFVKDAQGNLVAIINERVPDTGLHRFGDMHGMIDMDIAYEYWGQFQLMKNYSDLPGKVLRFFKSIHTVWSIGTHATNWLGNILVLAPTAGISLWNPLNWKYYRHAAKDFAKAQRSAQYHRWVSNMGKGPGNAINKAEVMQLAEHGIGMMYKGVLGHGQRSHKNIAQFIKGGMHRDYGMMAKAVGSSIEHAFEIPGITYQVADDFHRYALFLKKIDKAGAWKTPKGDLEMFRTVDIEAAAAGRVAFADYENLSGFFQVMRSRWWGQAFLAFDVRTAPVVMRGLSTNAPKLQFLFALQDYMVLQNQKDQGWDSDMMAARFEAMPGYKKWSATFLSDYFPEIFKGKYKYMTADLLKYAPLGRRLPYHSELENGLSLFEYGGRQAMSDQPLFTSFLVTGTGFSAFRGAIAYDELDSPGIKAKKVIEILVKTFTPPQTPVGIGYRDKRMREIKKGKLQRGFPKDSGREVVGTYGGLLVDFWTPAKIEAIGGQNMAWEVTKWSKRLRKATKAIRAIRNATDEDWANYQHEVQRVQDHIDTVIAKKESFKKLVYWFEDNEADLLEQGRALKFILQQKGLTAFRERVDKIRDDIRSKK